MGAELFINLVQIIHKIFISEVVYNQHILCDSGKATGAESNASLLQ